MKTFRYRDAGGESHELSWEREGNTLRSSEMEVELRGDRVLHQGCQLPYRVVRRGEKVAVWIDGELFNFEVETGSARRRGAEAAGLGGDQILSDMPGKILELRAQQGSEVEAGQVLVVMESMKMELTLTAPRDGVVKEIPVEVGRMVDQGTVLVQLEPQT